MASICKFFDEDAVYKINKKKFVDVGLVLENSEYLSSDEDDPDYREWGERMKKGHIRVAWHPNGAEEVLPEKKVRLCDRSLMPGDVVRRVVKGRDTQLGYCRCTQVRADVQVVGTRKVLTGVHSAHLRPLEEFVADVAVFKDSWVGMVKTVKTELTLRCSDGSRCLMSDVDAFDMEDVLDKRERASEFKKYSFYPGQQLWGPTFCFQKVKWLQLNKPLQESLNSPNKTLRAHVEDVRVTSLGVQWVCKAYSVENLKCTSTEQPKYHVTGEDLKSVQMMNIFEPCTLQIGDRNYLIMREDHEVISLHEWKNRMSGKLHSSPHPTKREGGEGQGEDEKESEEDEEESGRSSDASSVSSHSTVSSIENNAPSVVRKKRGPHYATKMKKSKMKSVRRRAMRHTMKEAPPLKTGDKLVTEALVTETKAHVVWQDGSLEEDILSTSLYPVHHLDSHEFFPGDYVTDSKDSRPHEYGVVKKVDHSGRTAQITWLKTYHAGGDPHPEVVCDQEVSVYDIKDHPDFKYRPGACVIRVGNSPTEEEEEGEGREQCRSAGQVVDVHPSGQVEVWWVGGDKSLCYPQELYRVGEYDSDDLWADDDSISDEDSWETESEKSLMGLEDNSLTEKDVSAEVGRDLERLSIRLEGGEEEKEGGEGEMQEKLLANIEKLRAGMARLEEVFTQNPTLQTCNVMRRLLELYKHCKVLDQLLGTTYFHERHLQQLVERLKHRGRVNSIQHMADQIFRLFTSPASNDFTPCNQETPCSQDWGAPLGVPVVIPSSPLESPIGTKENEEEGNWKDFHLSSPAPGGGGQLLSPVSPVGGSGSSSEPRNLCQQLCAILKSRLLKAHEDAELRFGMPRSETSAGLLAAEEPEPTPQPTSPCPNDPLPENVPASIETTVEPKTGEREETAETTAPSRTEEETNTAGLGAFSVLESVGDSHKYKLSIFQPLEPCAFFRTVRREMNLLKSSLPEGIIVKSFEDRIDLYSVLIKGPRRTPYEDGLFFFDFQLPADYPRSPPLCHYVSYCCDRLNPNLYEGGKVCVSLLGTWGGKGTEMWNPDTSNLLQVIVSIQGLILVCEPYYNEAGYERQKGTQLGMENSRMYNEMVVLKMVQSMTKLLINRPEVFREEIAEHFKTQSSKLVERLERWLEISESWNCAHPTSPTSPATFREMHTQSLDVPLLPEFPLVPASKGFCLTLRKSLVEFQEVLNSTSAPTPPPLASTENNNL